jgi:hypothetical protein
MEHARLSQLLNLYFDRELAGAEKAELERILIESDAARRFFWEYAALHGLTLEAATLKWARHAQEAGQTVVLSPEKSSDVPCECGSIWTDWRWGWGLAAAGILTLFSVGLYLGGHLDGNVAVLARALEVQWADATNGPAAGTTLKPGWLHLRHGAVQVDFYSGARVVFEGPAEFRILSQRKAFCRLGRFHVQVPEQGHGFKLETIDFNVVDLGTAFGLNIPPSGPTEVHVFTGRVELSRPGLSAPAVQLVKGEAARVEPKALHHLSASQSGFLSEADLARWDRPEVRRHHESWRQASHALSTDSAALLHYTFQDQVYWDRIVTNQVRGAVAESHGTIVGCEWTEGRWPGQKALQFDQPGDRVRLRLPQPLKSVTCLVWVRVDRLTNGYLHSLMTGDSEEPGSLRWTISQQGQIRLGVANPSAGPEATWQVAISPPVVKAERLGQWLMLTSVYDGKTLSHYLDGERVWSGPLKGPETVHFDWVEIGNWVATPRHPDFQWATNRPPSFFDRHFQGRMGEVAVLSRAMSAEEIRGFYASGQPLALAALPAGPERP